MQTTYRQTLISGLAYGSGLTLGNIISGVIFYNIPSDWFLFGNAALRLFLGIILAFIISGLGGVLGGLLGGYSLAPIGWGKSKGRRGHSWRSGITFGLGYGFLIFPVLLIVSLLAFYDVSDTPAYMFSLVFGVVGLIFGAIMGISLGMWTIGRRFAPISWMSMAGFGIGGAFLGYFVRLYIFSFTQGVVDDAEHIWLLLGLFLFASSGGAALGYIYQRAATRAEEALNPVRDLTLKQWQRRWLVTGLVLLGVALLLRPFIRAINDIFTPVDSGLAFILDLPTTGTHWLETTTLTAVSPLPHLTLSAGPDNTLVLAWTQDGDLWLQTGQWHPDSHRTEWKPPFLAYAGAITEPALAVDENGRYHLAWIENQTITLGQCQSDGPCAPPATIAPATNCAQSPTSGNGQPTLATNNGLVLLAWENAAGIIPYAAWAATAAPPASAANCVPTAISGPRLSPTFHLVFQSDEETIGLARFDGQNWAEEVEVGNGRFPTIAHDNANQPHLAWCNDNGLFYSFNNQPEFVAPGPCASQPHLALDSDSRPHLIWHSPTIPDVNGLPRAQNALVESIRQPNGWSRPAIVSHHSTATLLPAALTTAPDHSLHIAWANPAALQYTAQVQYQCQPTELSRYGQILYTATTQGNFWTPDSVIPFCQNQYDRLIYTPNPKPAYSDPHPPTPNGGFDVFADMIRDARYEALFSTMWYDATQTNDSPGSVVAEAIADLYRQLQANPERYPRGLTVRILLGNPPELAMGQATGQLWSLINDLREAGIDKMIDEELGWRLEVADYGGNLPHSHVKLVVIDGRTSAAVGFNMTHDHLPLEHVSGQGSGRFDIGIQLTGPIAQASQRAFDDLWQGSSQRVCLDLNPPLGVPWQITCYDRSGVSDHVPETQKFYLPGAEATAFSLYRSRALPMADEQIKALLAAAQTRIDATHVMFSLDMVCSLNLLFNVCTYENSPYYVNALLQALENGAHLRLLLFAAPFEGIENNVALSAFMERVAELGAEDQVEIRFFSGPFHPKTALIDDQMLIVGSQNFHYSAFGSGRGLAEYSLAVEDERAITEFQRAFDAEWAAARKR